MTSMRRTIAVMAFLALAGPEAWASSGWTGYGRVSELTPTVQGRFMVRLDVAGNPTGCRSKDSFFLDYGLPGSDFMFQALLGAVMTGKQVRVYVTGACDLDGYSRISAVTVIP